MTEKTPPEESIADEFQNLGDNIAQALRAAWENPELKQVQDEIVGGLNQLGNTLKTEAEVFSASPTGQRLKSDVEQLGERIRNQETHAKIRQELINVLHTANSEIQKLIDRWSVSDDSPGKDAPEESNPTESKEPK